MTEAIEKYHESHHIGNSIYRIYNPHSVFHCCSHQSALTSITCSRRWDQRKKKVACCKPELINDRKDRVRVIIVRTKSGMCKLNQYVNEII